MLRSHSPTLLYSYLRATIGSTRIARRAGIYVASEAAASGASTPKKNAMPSSALMKKRREARTRQTPIARTEPAALPMSPSFKDCFNTRRMTALLEAPIAILIPISRVRCETEYESTPRSEEHTSELQSRLHLVCRLLLEEK